MSKEDVKTSQLLNWDSYSEKAKNSSEDAAKAIYKHAKATVDPLKEWYWKSIKTKKATALWTRAITFALLFLGTLLPVFTEMGAPAGRVAQLELGLAALASAGLLMLADKVFGWSSGWVRYITTVTAIEALSTRFEMDWSGFRLPKDRALESNDIAQLYALAKKFVEDALTLQGDETDKWVTEFNSGTVALSEAIKAGKEAAQNSFNIAKAAATAAAGTGALQVTITRATATDQVAVSLDNEPAVSVAGQTWARSNVPLGVRLVHVINLTAQTKSVIRALVVQPNAVTTDTVGV